MLQTILHQAAIMSGGKKNKERKTKKLQRIGSNESELPGKSADSVLLYHYYFSALVL